MRIGQSISALRRRAIVLGAVLAAGLAAAVYAALPSSGPGAGTPPGPDGGDSFSAAGFSVVTAEPAGMSGALALAGTVEPGAAVNVTAPFEGVISKKHVDFGAQVRRGDVLLEFDASGIDLKIRESEVKKIKADQEIRKLTAWKSNAEVVRAQNAVLTAQTKVNDLTRKVEQNKDLLSRGIIPRNEYDNSVSELSDQKMTLQAEQQDLEAVLRKGDTEHRRIAALEHESAVKELKELRTQRAESVILAPADGLVLKSDSSGDGAKNTEEGQEVKKGAVLMAIADTRSIRIRALVDEIDINNLREGMATRVTGAAFQGQTLPGEIERISAQAADSFRQGADFEVIITVPDMPENLRRRVRIGMSAEADILIYDSPHAVIVPAAAVHADADGAYVFTPGEDGLESAVPTPVVTGRTNRDSVEIVSGLTAGQAVLIIGAPGGALDAAGSGSLPLQTLGGQ